MPQLDSLVLFSQAQLILLFFLGFYAFILYVMPLIYVSLSISNELLVYKYYKNMKNTKLFYNILKSHNRNYCYCLLFISNLEKYNQTKLHVFLGDGL